jgi:hypothetical protein
VQRDWSEAHAKVREEARCRIKGCKNKDLDPAHTFKRGLQDVDVEVLYFDDAAGCDRLKLVKHVLPDSIVPLCRMHHEQYDAHRLNLLPYLTLEEQADMARCVGLERAINRATGAKA